MEMPAIIENAFSEGFTLPALGDKVPDTTQTIQTARTLWDAQTFSDLIKGQVNVPDAVLNQTLAANLGEGGPVKALKVTSLKNHRIRIDAQTAKEGRVVLVCKVEQFVHNQEQSQLILKVTGKKLPGKSFVSWIFSRVSMAMVSKVVGHIDPGQGMNVAIHGNTITIDFRQALYASPIGQAEFFGYKPVDVLTIQSVTPQDGYITISTGLNMPEQLKTMLQNIL